MHRGEKKDYYQSRSDTYSFVSERNRDRKDATIGSSGVERAWILWVDSQRANPAVKRERVLDKGRQPSTRSALDLFRDVGAPHYASTHSSDEYRELALPDQSLCSLPSATVWRLSRYSHQIPVYFPNPSSRPASKDALTYTGK